LRAYFKQLYLFYNGHIRIACLRFFANRFLPNSQLSSNLTTLNSGYNNFSDPTVFGIQRFQCIRRISRTREYISHLFAVRVSRRISPHRRRGKYDTEFTPINTTERRQRFDRSRLRPIRLTTRRGYALFAAGALSYDSYGADHRDVNRVLLLLRVATKPVPASRLNVLLLFFFTFYLVPFPRHGC